MVSIRPKVPPDRPARNASAGGPHVLLSQIVFLLFCLEVGLVLLLLPWTLLWDNNYFFSLQPHYSEFWLSNHLRGAVSGIGIINLWMGFDVALAILRQRRAQPGVSASSRR